MNDTKERDSMCDYWYRKALTQIEEWAEGERGQLGKDLKDIDKRKTSLDSGRILGAKKALTDLLSYIQELKKEI